MPNPSPVQGLLNTGPGMKGKVLWVGFGGVWLLLGNHGHNSQAMDKTQGFGIANESKSSCLGNTVSTRYEKENTIPVTGEIY